MMSVSGLRVPMRGCESVPNLNVSANIYSTMVLYYKLSGTVVDIQNCAAVLKLDSNSKKVLAPLEKLCKKHGVPPPIKSGAVKLKVTSFTKGGKRVKKGATLDILTKASFYHFSEYIDMSGGTRGVSLQPLTVNKSKTPK